MIPPDLEQCDAIDVLRWVYVTHRRVALVASFQAESGVLIDMACRITDSPEVLTIDTGRLPDETLGLFDVFRERYPIRLRVLTPEPRAVEAMTAEHGSTLFYSSVDLRKLCCEVRKVLPLRGALREYDAWITGVRREQSASRGSTALITSDESNGGITKAAPLARWSRKDVVTYQERHSVPRHPLYARGYTSIGCAPCTRPTELGEHERAGRWWWERDAIKECGLHSGGVPPTTEKTA